MRNKPEMTDHMFTPYPMKLIPTLKTALWGGTRLADSWGKAPRGESVAESWELTVRQQEKNVIDNGALAGMTLNESLQLHPEMLGKCGVGSRFPLLIKFIDARQTLSVQVHPDDDYAARVERDSGKNEMWYIVEAAPDAEIVYGLRPGVTVSDFRLAVEENRIRDVLNFHPVCAGECYYIPAGLVHAIGAGILIAEIQQNSDLTYRVYDYDRVGADGKPRELHRKKACDVVVPRTQEEILAKRYAARREGEGEMLAHPTYFCVRHGSSAPESPYVGYVGKESFVHLLCLSGAGILSAGDSSLRISRGDSIFLPADMGEFTVTGTVDFLETQL